MFAKKGGSFKINTDKKTSASKEVFSSTLKKQKTGQLVTAKLKFAFDAKKRSDLRHCRSRF